MQPHGLQIPFPNTAAAKKKNAFARFALHQNFECPAYDFALGA